VIIKADVADELEAALPAVERVDIGKGKHYVQEDQPDAIGRALDDWLGRLD
jgi:haloalkane dehalogenase